jgi:hypothetical protein
MALPASYTEQTIAQYMHNTLGQTATLLGWADPAGGVVSPYDEAVNDALLLYGVSNISTATDIAKLRAAARLAIWRRVVDWSYGFFDFATDGQRFDLGELRELALKRLAKAEQEAAGEGIDVGNAPPVQMASIFYSNDPYIVVDDDERALP